MQPPVAREDVQGSPLMRASLVALPPEAPAALAPPVPEAQAPAPEPAQARGVLVAGSGAREAMLELAGDSWVEVVDGSGRRVHQALMRPGQWRFRSDGMLAFTIGNARTARLLADGQPLDLDSHRSTNDVARIEVFGGD